MTNKEEIMYEALKVAQDALDKLVEPKHEIHNIVKYAIDVAEEEER